MRVGVKARRSTTRAAISIIITIAHATTTINTAAT